VIDDETVPEEEEEMLKLPDIFDGLTNCEEGKAADM